MTELTDNAVQNRYEMEFDGRIAFVKYLALPDRVVLTHAEVPQELGGRGIGGKLGYAVLDDLRTKGKKVEPRCSFMAALIKRRPEYQDMVAGA